jgi:hypothetical protein
LRHIALAGCLLLGCSSTRPATDGSGQDAASDAYPPNYAQLCRPGPDAGDLPCDVSAVFQARCQHCHTIPKPPPPDNAPFPLRAYEDLVAPFGTTGLLRWQRVSQVIEPGNFPHMPPPTQPQLTDSDFATLHAWFMACAPPLREGTGCDIGEDSGAGGDAGGDANGDASGDASADAAGEAHSDGASGAGSADAGSDTAPNADSGVP